MILYKMINCPRCQQLEDYLHINNISYEVKDIEKDFIARARMISRDIDEMPVLEIDGRLYHGNMENLKRIAGESID